MLNAYIYQHVCNARLLKNSFAIVCISFGYGVARPASCGPCVAGGVVANHEGRGGAKSKRATMSPARGRGGARRVGQCETLCG